MKKITLMIFLMFGMLTFSMAQTTKRASKATTSKQDKAAIAAQKKADKEAKEAAKKQAKEQAKEAKATTDNTAHLNKNGKPDKRFKANKEPKAATAGQTQASAPAPAQTQTATKSASSMAHTRAPKSPDKEIGTDSKGRTLYQGPRGGKYYLTANGHKEYVK